MDSADADRTSNLSNQGTPSDLSSGPSGGFHIPVSNDSGFYGYNEEKHLHHVSTPAHALTIASNETNGPDGREVDRAT